MEYIFGAVENNSNPNYYCTCKIQAKSLEFAIRFFLVSSPYPEWFVSQNIFTDKSWEDAYTHHSYKELDKSRIDEGTIDIGCYKNGKYVKLSEISLRKCLEADFEEIVRECGQTDPMLIGDGQESTEETEKALIPSNMPTITKMSEFRDMQTKISLQIQELERQKWELRETIDRMHEWLDSKTRVLRAFETYLGTEEEIVTLIESPVRADDLPLHIYQQKLYMDEEYGIVSLTSLEDVKDFDFESLGLFDEWIKKHYKMYMPHKKSICVFQVCRVTDKYGDDVWKNLQMDGVNGITYFLIRNGENLYRIFSGVHVPDSVFPTEEQTEKIYFHVYTTTAYDPKGKGKTVKTPLDEKQVQQNMLPWRYVTAYLQGLIDRTDIVGTNLRGKVNFLLNIVPEEYCVLERNMEKDNYIEDKLHPLWRDFRLENVRKTRKGDKVLLCALYRGYGDGRAGVYDFISSHGMDDRRVRITPPSSSMSYKVEDIKKSTELNVSSYMRSDDRLMYKILYFESDELYDYWGDSRPRKRRTGLWLEDKEILNLTRITEEELIFYLNDRRHRQSYRDDLPMLQVALKMKRDMMKGGEGTI